MTLLAEVDLVLASTSRYRRELLSRLTTRFSTLAPQVDETARAAEMPCDLAARLAEAKAREVAARAPGTLVIGSDQVADLDGRVLGKPGSVEKSRAQLAACSTREVVFYTAICLIDTRSMPSPVRSAIDTTRVRFRQLDADEIRRYVEREQPLDCAGSFKAEALGIALFERIESFDPTALIGLPLIELCRVLRDAGIAIL
jgi:septum formation protein